MNLASLPVQVGNDQGQPVHFNLALVAGLDALTITLLYLLGLGFVSGARPLSRSDLTRSALGQGKVKESVAGYTRLGLDSKKNLRTYIRTYLSGS